MRRPVIGVMGGASVPESVKQLAYRLGILIANKGWILLNGGRDAGVMLASAEGARDGSGMVVGILPEASDRNACPHLDLAIVTGMGDARNVINVLSSDVVIACQGGSGTLSEVSMALKNGKRVVALRWTPGHDFDQYKASHQLVVASTPEQAVELAATFLANRCTTCNGDR